MKPDPQAATLPVSSVHEALSRAVDAERKRVAMRPYNFKCNPFVLETAEAICVKNATTLPAFFRQCAELLIADYAGPKAANARLNAEAAAPEEINS